MIPTIYIGFMNLTLKKIKVDYLRFRGECNRLGLLPKTLGQLPF